MSSELRRDLQQLPPHMDITTDFYDRVMIKARRRQYAKRVGSTGIAAAVVGIVIAITVNVTGTASTAQIIPVAPPATSSSPSPSPGPFPIL